MTPELKPHYPFIHEVIVKAQEEIYQKIGISIKLIVRKVDTDIDEMIVNEWGSFLTIWNISLEDLKHKNREEPLPTYRKILWMYAKTKHPKISLNTIGALLGIGDHTTVIHGINSTYDLLSVQDDKFLCIYNPVKHLF